jgi:hypothetical protein
MAANNHDTTYFTENKNSYITVNEIKLAANNNYKTYCTEYKNSYMTVNKITKISR